METTKIPRAINPDNLIDSYIELTFDSDYKSTFLIDEMLSSIDQENKHFRKLPITNRNEMSSDKVFLTDDIIRFFILENKLGINSVGEYRGWDYFGDRVAEIIMSISKHVVFNNIRMKYVSKWDEISILDNIDGEVCFEQFGKRFDGTEVRFQAATTNPVFRSFAQVSLKDMIFLEDERCSLVDIDLNMVIPKSEKNLDMTLKALHQIHSDEKDMFFKLLSDEFVKSLNPG